MMDILFAIGDHLELIANLAIVITALRFVWSFRRVTYHFSCGDITLRQRDVSIQNLTNMVSVKFFQGGNIPAQIRSEILRTALPPFS